MAKLTYTKTPKNLIDHILAHSTANIFEEAIKELTPVGFYCDHGKCPCGQPIIQHCIIENHTNQQRTVVGNICVQRFMHINTGTTFTSLQAIIQDISKHPSKDLIAAALESKYISPREAKFLTDIQRKRNMSAKQEQWLQSINKKIIEQSTSQRVPNPIPAPNTITPPSTPTPPIHVHAKTTPTITDLRQTTQTQQNNNTVTTYTHTTTSNKTLPPNAPITRDTLRQWKQDGTITEKEAIFLYRNINNANKSEKQQQWYDKIIQRIQGQK